MNKLPTNGSLFSKASIPYVLAMAICAVAISIVDSLLPLGVSIGEAYILLVLIGFMSRDVRLVAAGAIVGTVLVLEGFYISEEGVAIWIVWTNRLLSIFIIWISAVFAYSQIRFLQQQEESEKIKKAHDLLQKESKYLELFKEIAILSNCNDPVEDALKQAMQKICDFTGWSVAHLYLRNGDEEMLSPSKYWVLKDWDRSKEFREKTDATTFATGVGLPGRVLASKKVAWIKNLSKDTNFPRGRLAQENGLKSGLAFPILIGPKVVAVMEFYHTDTIEPDSKLMEVMETIGYLLGRIFERDHAGLKKGEYEDHLRRLYARMKAVRDQDNALGGNQHIAENIHEELR